MAASSTWQRALHATIQPKGWTARKKKDRYRFISGRIRDYRIVAEPGCRRIGQAAQVIHPYAADNGLHAMGEGIRQRPFPLEAGAGGYQDHIGVQALLADNPVLRSLFQADEGPHGGAEVAVAGRLSAPGAAVGHHASVRLDAHHGIVVIEQLRAGDILQPEPAVGAFARAARAQEQVGLPLTEGDGGVEQQGGKRQGTPGIEQHQGVVQGALGLAQTDVPADVQQGGLPFPAQPQQGDGFFFIQGKAEKDFSVPAEQPQIGRFFVAAADELRSLQPLFQALHALHP